MIYDDDLDSHQTGLIDLVTQNNTMFLDLSELGPRPNDPEFDDDKSENSPQTEVDLFENHSEPQRK